MKGISMQSFNNDVNVQFVPHVMLKQVTDNCSVGETSSFNYRIIAIMESIQRVVCLHVKFVQTLNSLYMYFELRFVSLHRKFATSNFVIANNQRSSLIFQEDSNEICLESSLIFRSKFARTKGEFRRISFAFLLHNTVS